MNTQIRQRIIENLQSLDSFQLSEVLNFVESIYCKNKTVPLEPNIIDKLCGKYRDSLSSSDEFARRKQEEIKLEE
jgi:hypothetical protein